MRYRARVSDDLELLERWREGDKAAGEALARRHYREIFGRVSRGVSGDMELAAELTQQVFEVVVSRKEDIAVDVRRYLHGIARFKLSEHYRRRASSAPAESRHASLMDPGHGIVSVLSREEDARLLVEALRTLHVEDQTYILWFYVDRLTQSQIAERVGLTTSRINGRLHRARMRLRKEMEARGGSGPKELSDEGFDTWMASLRRNVDAQHGL